MGSSNTNNQRENNQAETLSTRPIVTTAQSATPADTGANADSSKDDDDDDDADSTDCFICANKITYYSITPCNHRTCHICDLRVRALYKTKNCLTCRVGNCHGPFRRPLMMFLCWHRHLLTSLILQTPVDYVIFTADGERPYNDFSATDVSTIDTNLGIKYANEDIVGDTVLLLRYNCPEPTCDFAGLGWPNLHKHVRTVHHKRMCDLCTRNKKLFTHEHELLTDRELERHTRKGDDRPGAVDQTGFKGHTLCTFCGERFHDDDRLFEHCRARHERCFLCDRRDSRQPHYYRDYDSLEKHFQTEHFLCKDRECLEKKFVVFESEMDLRAHTVGEHSGGAGRDARRVDMSQFNFRESYQQARRGDRGGHGRDGSSRLAGDATPGPTPAQAQAQAQAQARAQTQQRQMAIHSAQSVTSRTFGGQLSGVTGVAPSAHITTTTTTSSPATSDATQTADSSAPMTVEQRTRALRHTAVNERASSLVHNNAAKMAAFRAIIAKFKHSSETASTTLDSFFTLFADASPNAISTLVREVAELYEDQSKSDGLRNALADWRAINEDYPSLPGLGGMHGSTTATSGWASAAAASPSQGAVAPDTRHRVRVLTLKSATKKTLGGGGGGGDAGSTTVEKKVEAVAAAAEGKSGGAGGVSAEAFPALPESSSKSTQTGSLATRSNWATPSSTTASLQPTPAAAASMIRSSTPLSKKPTSSRATASASSSTANSASFPALPPAAKPVTSVFTPNGRARAVMRGQAGAGAGTGAGTGFVWGGDAGADTEEELDGGEEEAKKKGKGKKKEVLLHWG